MNTCLKSLIGYTCLPGGHWSSASEYIKYLICHVTSKNHVTEELWNFLSGSSSWYVTSLSCLVAIDIVVVEIKCFYFLT